MATIFRKAHCSNFFALAFAVAMGIATSGHAMDVTLGWNANTETNLKGYKIYYGTNQGGPYNGSGSSDGASPLVASSQQSFNPEEP
jgi:hypothetical protein